MLQSSARFYLMFIKKCEFFAVKHNMEQPNNILKWFSNKETTNKRMSAKEPCILKYVKKHDYVNLGLAFLSLMSAYWCKICVLKLKKT